LKKSPVEVTTITHTFQFAIFFTKQKPRWYRAQVYTQTTEKLDTLRWRFSATPLFGPGREMKTGISCVLFDHFLRLARRLKSSARSFVQNKKCQPTENWP
jgi:hypothetical protein